MGRVLKIFAVLSALWCGYWVIGAQAMEMTLKGWIEDRAQEGWVAEYSSLNTHGFPNRLETTVTDLELADPRSGLGWSAPRFQVRSYPHKPNHVDLIWPKSQTLINRRERIEITSTDMRGALVVGAQTSLPLKRSTLSLEQVALASSAGWTAGVEQAQVTAQAATGGANTYDLSVMARGIKPASNVMQMISGANLLPPAVDALDLGATVSFDVPIDRFVIDRTPPPQLREIKLSTFDAKWGDLELAISGGMTIDNTGMPDGTFLVKAKNWRKIVQILIESGVVAPELEPTVTSALQFLSEMSGDPETLDTELKFQDQQIWFGPVSLGPAPRIVIR